jgi:hypothetical protein
MSFPILKCDVAYSISESDFDLPTVVIISRLHGDDKLRSFLDRLLKLVYLVLCWQMFSMTKEQSKQAEMSFRIELMIHSLLPKVSVKDVLPLSKCTSRHFCV